MIAVTKRVEKRKKAAEKQYATRVPEFAHPAFSLRIWPGLSAGIMIPLGCGLVAAVAMFTNLSYGLPFYYHPDEPIKAMSAVELVRGGIPARFNHPHFMLFFSVPFLYVGNSLGAHPVLAARAAVATLGVATVGLLFLVGRSLGGRVAGLAAALIYATAPLAVVSAHDFKEDIPLAFWLTVQLFFLVRYLRGARSRDLFLASVALGGAVGTKYTGLIATPLLVGTVVFGPASDRRGRILWIATVLAAAGFLLSTPSVLRHPRDFLTGVSFEAQHAVLGHGMRDSLDPEGRYSVDYPGDPLRISAVSSLWTYHLRHSLAPGISIVGLLLVLVGAFMAVTRGDRAWWLAAAGLGLFYLALETLPLKPPPFAARYMVAVLPYAALLGGGALGFAWDDNRPIKALIGLLFAVTIGMNGFRSLQQVKAMRPDTRDGARTWILQNVPRGARLILPGLIWYTPFAGSLRQQDFPYEIAALENPPSSQLLTASLDPQAYLVVSSFNYQRYLDHPDFNPDMYRFYRLLFDRYAPLMTVKVPFHPLGYHNPTIMIFHLTDRPSAQRVYSPTALGTEPAEGSDSPRSG